MVCMLLPFVCWFLVKQTSVQNIAFQKEEEEEEKKKKKRISNMSVLQPSNGSDIWMFNGARIVDLGE